MVIYRSYDFYLADVFSDAIRLFLLFPVHISLGTDGWFDRVCSFQLWDGGSGEGWRGCVAFHGDCSLDDLFTTYGRNCQSVQDICFVDSRHDDIVVYRGRRVVFVILANI